MEPPPHPPMPPSQQEMDFFGSVEDMCFVSEDRVGFPAVKSKVWPTILEKAKTKVREDFPDDEERDGLLERANALHTLATARGFGGDPAVKVFREVNEDIVRFEMSAALNKLMPGNVNRMWSKRDFQGLGACYGRVFHSMQVSESRLVNRMPVLFIAGLLQLIKRDTACLSSGWWKNEKKCLEKLGVAVKKICAGGFRKGERAFINHFAKLFVAGIALINELVDDEYSFRDMLPVIEALEEGDPSDPSEYLVEASIMEGVEKSLKVVHPSFHAEFLYALNLHLEIAELGKLPKGKAGNLKKYAVKAKGNVLVACFLPFAKDAACMLHEVGKLISDIELNGYFQHVVGIFENADEEETKKSKYPTAYGRALLMSVPLTFPHLIQQEFAIDACVNAVLARLPPSGGFGKPPKRRGKKRRRDKSPPKTPEEVEKIHRLVLGSDEDEEEEEELASGKATD